MLLYVLMRDKDRLKQCDDPAVQKPRKRLAREP